MSFNLNQNQKEAVYYDGEEPLIIEAGPGSGKTRVLTERVKFLLNEKNVDPETLLVITFTRKATEELKSRLSEDIEADIINKMQISTIHGFCYELLKKYNNFAYSILDDDYNQKKTLFIQKNKFQLGFKDQHYISNGSISNVIDKYGEYSTFNVDSDSLVDYISNNRVISQDYIDLIEANSEKGFPYDDVNKNSDLKDSWYNARYLQIAKSYPNYIKLLDDNYLVDYDTLQIKTLEFLDKNPITIYKNILIDEFQDVNPVQYYIFEKLLPFADTFTVVGDIDQSIYGFRGALFDYFENLIKDYNGHVVSLDLNYRSSENIVGLTEEFIKPYRNQDSQKNMKHVKEYNNNSYYITSEKELEAENILEYIKRIKNNGIIEKYSDIAILLRSLKGNMIKDLIDLFKQEEIPYDVRNFSTLLENDDIKSIMMLLYYIIPSSADSHIFSKLERDWLNLRGFTGDKFEPTLWHLSDETNQLLNKLQDDFEQNAVKVAKEVYEDEFGEKPRISSFSGLFNKNKFTENKTEEMMIEIFKKAKRPQIDLDLINDGEDKEFFQKLENLKVRVNANVGRKITTHLEKIKNNYKKEYDSEFNNRRLNFVIDLANKNKYYIDEGIVDKLEEFKELVANNKLTDNEAIILIDNIIGDVKGYDDNLTILNIFYELLNITDFFNNPSEKSLSNFAAISESMYNFEDVMDVDDLVGYFRFLQNNVGKWEEKAVIASEGVQIMTIHKSKGLEFPVVIVPSIKEGKFPKEYEDPSQKDFIFPNYTYYTPNCCLEYKKDLEYDDEYYHDMEEKRILYVAMTRAQDSLLLSFIDEIHPMFNDIVNKNYVKQLDYSTFDKCESVYENDDEEIISASYTSLNTFEECPFKYQLIYDLNFKVSDSKEIRVGSAVHDVFNKINVAKIENPQITNKKIDKIIYDIFTSTSNISQDDEEFEEFKNNIYKFYNQMGDVKLLESEYGFNIRDKDYNIVGSIDLIYEKDGEIGIIDYKNTELIGNNIDKYKNQLKIYIHALSFDSKYNDKNISKAGIYGVKTDNLVIDNISEEEIKSRVLEIKENIKKIKDKEFDKCPSGLCNYCDFKFICDN